MHTVSLFPAFFDYQILGIFLLRITLGFIFVYFWYNHVARSHKRDRYYNLIYSLLGVAGALLVVGLYTQAVVIATGALMSIAALMKWKRVSFPLHETTLFYVLLAIVSFSLLFLGPGAFAIDLPL